MDYRQSHTQEWLDHFARGGYPAVEPLAAGVEGAVYRLGDGTVAKVWGRRRPAELLLWQAFYADLAAGGLPFATPVILRVDQVRDVAVTVERELPGRPLQARLGTEDREVDQATTDCVVGILRALAAVPATAGMSQLPVRATPSLQVRRYRRSTAASGGSEPPTVEKSASGLVSGPLQAPAVRRHRPRTAQGPSRRDCQPSGSEPCRAV